MAISEGQRIQTTKYLCARAGVTYTATVPDTTSPTVTLTAPNGGEEWAVGSSHNITWSASDDVDVTAVDLYYSTTGPTGSWTEIATGESDDGSYSWTIPDDVDATVWVKVVAKDLAANEGSDVSDASFAIYEATGGDTAAPVASLDVTGNILTIAWTLTSGTWDADVAVDTTKTLTVIVDDGGDDERTIGVDLVNVASAVTRDNDAGTNDRVTVGFYLTGDLQSHPEYDTAFDSEAVAIAVADTGLLYDGSARETSGATSGAVTNNSTTVKPTPIFQWVTPPKQRYTSATIDIYFCAFHKHGIDLSASSMTLTDSGTNEYEAVLSKQTLSRDGDYGPATQYSVYRARFDAAGADAGNATISVVIAATVAGTNYVTATEDLPAYPLYIDLSDAHPTTTAYVNDLCTLAYTSQAGGDWTALYTVVGGTSGARGIVDPSSALSGGTLTICPTTKTDFQAAETLTEYDNAGDASGVTATCSGTRTSLASGSPELGEVDEPYASVNDAAVAICNHVNGEAGGYGKVAAGSTIYLLEGVHTWNGATDPNVFGCLRGDHYAFITRDPAAAKADVILTRYCAGTDGAILALQNLKMSGLTIQVLDGGDAKTVCGFGSGDDPFLWIHDCNIKYWGTDNTETQAFIANADHYAETSCLYDNYGTQQPSGMVRTAGTFKLLRDTEYDLGGASGDVRMWGSGQGDELLLNMTVDSLQGAAAANHSDVVQTVADVNNIIIYNAKWTTCLYQAAFFGGGPAQSTNMALVNVIAEQVDDDDIGSGGIPVDNNWAHFLLWNYTGVSVPDKLCFAIDTGSSNYDNLSVRNCYLHETNSMSTAIPSRHAMLVNVHTIYGTSYGVRATQSGDDVRDLFDDVTDYTMEYPGCGGDDWIPTADGDLDNRLLARDIIDGVDYDIYGTAWAVDGAVGAAMAGS